MRGDSAAGDDTVQRIGEAYRRAAEVGQQQGEAIRSLHGMLIQLSEDNLRLHQRNLAALQAIRVDLDRVKQRLKRLAVGRT